MAWETFREWRSTVFLCTIGELGQGRRRRRNLHYNIYEATYGIRWLIERRDLENQGNERERVDYCERIRSQVVHRVTRGLLIVRKWRWKARPGDRVGSVSSHPSLPWDGPLGECSLASLSAAWFAEHGGCSNVLRIDSPPVFFIYLCVCLLSCDSEGPIPLFVKEQVHWGMNRYMRGSLEKEQQRQTEKLLS